MDRDFTVLPCTVALARGFGAAGALPDRTWCSDPAPALHQADLDGTGGLRAIRDVRDGCDVLYGGNGADGIYGGDSPTSGENEIYGGPGADIITAGNPAAFDEVYGGSGNDTVYAEDDTIDYVDCGVYPSPTNSLFDTDTVYADRVSDGDTVNDVLYECEIVN